MALAGQAQAVHARHGEQRPDEQRGRARPPDHTGREDRGAESRVGEPHREPGDEEDEAEVARERVQLAGGEDHHDQVPAIREERGNRGEEGEPGGRRGLPAIHAQDDRHRPGVEEGQPDGVEVRSDVDEERRQQDEAAHDARQAQEARGRRPLEDGR